MGTVGLITYPESGPIGRLADLFATFAASIDRALPVKFVDTLAQLNAISLSPGALLPGTLAVLAADDAGLAAGAQFTMNPDGKWRLAGSCTALDVDIFVAQLTTLTNIKTLPGATCWDSSHSFMLAFTSTAGAYSAVTTVATRSGSGQTDVAIAVGGTFSVAIGFPPGSFDVAPSNIIVTCESTRGTTAAVTRTSTGFSLQISNWSNATLAANTKYWWTALA